MKHRVQSFISPSARPRSLHRCQVELLPKSHFSPLPRTLLQKTCQFQSAQPSCYHHARFMFQANPILIVRTLLKEQFGGRHTKGNKSWPLQHIVAGILVAVACCIIAQQIKEQQALGLQQAMRSQSEPSSPFLPSLHSTPSSRLARRSRAWAAELERLLPSREKAAHGKCVEFFLDTS